MCTAKDDVNRRRGSKKKKRANCIRSFSFSFVTLDFMNIVFNVCRYLFCDFCTKI